MCFKNLFSQYIIIIPGVYDINVPEVNILGEHPQKIIVDAIYEFFTNRTNMHAFLVNLVCIDKPLD